ncbi:hypothetical protein ACET66_06555 [Aeromonas simiae]|uniref:hypothetical protein n=1 Tax=Aeromonas simiae TaxID=218936 RepID=UPI0038D170A1
MPISTSFLEKNIESVSKIATTASKFGILIGGICVITYSLRINHFPQDLSVGDGLLFLMAAACFGVIYVFFTASLVSLGIAISPAIRVVINIFVWGVNLFHKRKAEPAYTLAPFQLPAVLFALFSVVIILALGRKDSTAYWNLPMLSVGLYLFYSVYISSGNKLNKIETVKNTILHTNEKENIVQLGDPEKLRQVQLFSLSIILVLPLLIGGVSGQLLDAAMRAANVRVEKPIIYVKEPYSSLLPKALTLKNRNAPKGYTTFDGTVVLFKGFGKTTVISFPDSTVTRKLEIPNNKLIIENR